MFTPVLFVLVQRAYPRTGIQLPCVFWVKQPSNRSLRARPGIGQASAESYCADLRRDIAR